MGISHIKNPLVHWPAAKRCLINIGLIAGPLNSFPACGQESACYDHASFGISMTLDTNQYGNFPYHIIQTTTIKPSWRAYEDILSSLTSRGTAKRKE